MRILNLYAFPTILSFKKMWKLVSNELSISLKLSPAKGLICQLKDKLVLKVMGFFIFLRFVGNQA